MKDLFVSYGRRESLVFVGRLHQQLKLAGYDAWFDKVNIPDGDDYAQRISHGIESAHNFAYVMAPRCMTSPYCLIELEYARILGKRIIPVAQIVIFDTPAKELSEADKQVMVDFYKFHAIEGVTIHTEQDVLKRSHALLGKADWIYAREEYQSDDIQRMFEWQSSHENLWYKHDDKEYLQQFQFPSFGKTIDNLSAVCESLIRVIEKHKDYTIKHTEILLAALAWKSKNQMTESLLVGMERKEADKWLLTEFVAPEQPPCTPSDLHAEFICESRKNAENLHTDAFICYDMADKILREKVSKSLSKAGITTWIHHKDISKSENYEEAIQRGIEQADNLIFFISNNSVLSEYCLKELRYALLLNKRVVPLLLEPLTPESQAIYKGIKRLQQIQYIDLTNNASEEHYQNDIKDLLREIHRDRRYYEQHKVFLVQALKWETQGKNPSILLRGYNLQNAQTWLKTSSKRTSHKPIKIQEEFINESAAHAGEENIDVFISYSRNDGDFARKINEQLQINGRSTWFDQDSIAVGADFQKEIYKGIANSNNFVFLISNKSITSPYCADEVAYAEQQGKRIITLRLESVEKDLLPASLASIQWIDAGKDKDFSGVFSQLIRALDVDRTHVESHSKWQHKALEWQKTNKDASLLLIGSEFSVAELWLQESVEQKKQPQPTAVQQEFITASRKAIEETAEKEGKIALVLKKRLKVMRLALAASAFLLFAALVAMSFAFTAMNNSDKSAEIASLATENAKEEARRADSLNRISITTASRLSSFQGETFRLIHYLKLQYSGRNVQDSIRQIVNSIDPINKTLVLFKDGLNKFGFTDTNGNLMIPAFFDEAEEFKDKKANVRVGEGRYILSPDGTRQIAQEANKMWEWKTIRLERPAKKNAVEKFMDNLFGKKETAKKQEKSLKTITDIFGKPKQEEKKEEPTPKTEEKVEEKTEKPKSKFGKFWRNIIGKEEKTAKEDTKTPSTTEETKTEEPKKEVEIPKETSQNATESQKITSTTENTETDNSQTPKFRIPNNAVSATLNPADEYDMYVMRSRHKDLTQKMWGIESGLQVGYVTSSKAMYSYEGNAIENTTVEVLVLKAPRENFAWIDYANLTSYEQKGWAKLQGGWEGTGQPVFVTRIKQNNGYVLGKGVKGCAMIPINGKEITICDKYEVLMYKIPESEIEYKETNAVTKVEKHGIYYLQNNVGKITGLAAEPFGDWKWINTEKPGNFKFKIPLTAYPIDDSQADSVQYFMRVQREDGSMYIGSLSESKGTYGYEKSVLEARIAQVLTIHNKSKFVWVENTQKAKYLADGYKLVQGGWEADGMPMYIARAKKDDNYYAGQAGTNACKIVVRNRVVMSEEYEVLMWK